MSEPTVAPPPSPPALSRAAAARRVLLPRLLSLGPSTLVLAAGGLGTLLIQVVAQRLMSQDEVGRLVLALGILSIASTAAGMGIPQLLARRVAADRGVLGTRAALLRVTLVGSTALGLVQVGASLGLYPGIRDLRAGGAIVLLLLVSTRALQYLEAAYRRGSGALLSGAVVQQAAALAAAAILAVALATHTSIGATGALEICLIAQLALVLYSLADRRPTRAGVDGFGWVRQERSYLLVYWWTAVLAVAFLWADRLVVGGLLSLADLADYQDLVLLTTAFDIVALGVGYVHLPRYAEAGFRSSHDRKLVGVLSTAAAVVTLVFAFSIGGWIFVIDWTPTHVAVLFILIAVGVCKLLYADLSAAIGGMGDLGGIRRFAFRMTVVFIVGALVMAALTALLGVVGAALGGLVAWAGRVGFAHLDSRLHHSEVVP